VLAIKKQRPTTGGKRLAVGLFKSTKLWKYVIITNS
jgi:hypothetical protein